MQKEMMYMRRFDFNLREELFNRIKLMADFYNIPVSKMMIQLLEIGYIDMLDTRKTNNNFERLGDEYDN